MNRRNVDFETPKRSKSADSQVASIRFKFERIREHVGFWSRSAASRFGKTSQHESDEAHTQSARPSEQVDSVANFRCLLDAALRVQTEGGQLRMKLVANCCSDRYLYCAVVFVTSRALSFLGNIWEFPFYANSRSNGQIEFFCRALAQVDFPYNHRTIEMRALGRFSGYGRSTFSLLNRPLAYPEILLQVT